MHAVMLKDYSSVFDLLGEKKGWFRKISRFHKDNTHTHINNHVHILYAFLMQILPLKPVLS